MRCMVSTVPGNRPNVSWMYVHTAFVQARPSSLISTAGGTRDKRVSDLAADATRCYSHHRLKADTRHTANLVSRTRSAGLCGHSEY